MIMVIDIKANTFSLLATFSLILWRSCMSRTSYSGFDQHDQIYRMMNSMIHHRIIHLIMCFLFFRIRRTPGQLQGLSRPFPSSTNGLLPQLIENNRRARVLRCSFKFSKICHTIFKWPSIGIAVRDVNDGISQKNQPPKSSQAQRNTLIKRATGRRELQAL